MESLAKELFNSARDVMSGLTDKRKSSNALRYKMETVGMAGLSVFFMQEPSFLQHQQKLQQSKETNNYTNLFGGDESIPTDNHIRNLLDEVSFSELEAIYDKGLQVLQKHNGLKQFEFLEGYMISLDGTAYHSSKNIFCEQCKRTTHGDKTTYTHGLLATALVTPGIKEAIALVPEFITPQDGQSKQDCENAAVKRWLNKHAQHYTDLKPIYLGDEIGRAHV